MASGECVDEGAAGAGGYYHPNNLNMHPHGLHVSPMDPEDEVLLLDIGPGETFEYIYQIPQNHMPGTFW